MAACGVLFLGATVVPASADVGDFIGKPIVTQHVQADGRTLIDDRVFALLETHVGEPLRMAAVRQSIVHLFSLGRYAGVDVRATPAGNGVSLSYVLAGARQVAAITLSGTAVAGVDESRIRRAIAERFGARPGVERAPEIAALVQDELRTAGYLRSAVRWSADQPGEHRARLVVAVTPGERARIGAVTVDGGSGVSEGELARTLQLSTGAPFERERLAERIERYLEGARRDGFYAARLTYSPELADDGRTVNVRITVDRGPRVRIVLAGDPLPLDRQELLVPVAREGSVDEDLLEDASQRIEEHLRTEGYHDAMAPFTREEIGTELVITFTVRRGVQHRVGRIDLSGNVSIPLTDLQPRMRVRAGQPFFQPAVDADLATIEGIYRARGFTSARAEVTSESQQGATATEVSVALRVAVSEGVRTEVASVRVEGASALPDARLREGLLLQPGGPFSVAQMAADRDAVQLRLANLGYQSAQVVPNPGLSSDTTRADVVFTVREGPRIFVDHVLIVGNERTRTATIERELQFKAGDPLGLEALNETQRRLAALGLFRRARITELRHGDGTKRDVLVTVEEAPATTIGYGGGVEVGQRIRESADTGAAVSQVNFAPRAFFEVGRRNLFGKNRSINLFTRVSLNNLQSSTAATGFDLGEYRIIGTYREPRVFGSGADAFVTGTLEQQIRSSFNFTRRALGAEIGRRLTRVVSVSGNYQLQRTEVFDEVIDPAFRIPIDRLFPQVRLSSFSGLVVRDTRNDSADPASGRFLSANGQVAGRRIGSEVGFGKTYLVAQSFSLLPGTGRVVLALSGRLGLAAGFTRVTSDLDENGNPVLRPDGQPITVVVRDLPASERFFTGGDTTVRGFALDQVGTPETIDKDGFPTGGNGLVVVNAEVRVPLLRGVGMVGFVDAGNVFRRASDIELARLRSSVGFGFRYRSPIGPLRVDVGFKMNRETMPSGLLEPLTALHISLGQAF